MRQHLVRYQVFLRTVLSDRTPGRGRQKWILTAEFNNHVFQGILDVAIRQSTFGYAIGGVDTCLYLEMDRDPFVGLVIVAAIRRHRRLVSGSLSQLFLPFLVLAQAVTAAHEFLLPGEHI